jgi:hypothetical protein
MSQQYNTYYQVKFIVIKILYKKIQEDKLIVLILLIQLILLIRYITITKTITKTDFKINFKTKICKDGFGRRKLTDQEQLASEQRGKELKHQTYLINKDKRKKTYINKRDHINNTCKKITLKNEVLNIIRNRKTKNAKLSRKNDKDSTTSAPKERVALVRINFVI